MSSLLVIEKKLFENAINKIRRSKNCNIIIIQKNLLEVLKRKKIQANKIILITENILPRNSIVYKSIKSFIKNKKIFFVEIGYNKSTVSQEMAASDALVNGSGNNTEMVLEKIIKAK
ncbi:MAG: hypothetical protein CFH34_01397 [Alphaproteobacteria bacterium MarineAlpha9_Bin4]|nr:hypothetical protein [Pelagibacterales bacterium]PPR25532.1 MAG: hypothetical protein CFH34_01397 [Alphaproteobacteria bacterium MarineAlpha9_Bin4]|tara:strand:+ start:3800 stop:4150 length:351 start_codon:yes stop_codon:yes gene_type:complete